MTRQARFLLPLLALLAIGVGVFATSGVDTGPEVGERAARTRRVPRAPSASEPAPDDAPVAPPVVAPARPFSTVSGGNPAALPLRPSGAVVGNGAAFGSASSDAAATTTGRRLTMMENLFGAAARAVPEGPDQDAVRRVLDGALEEMRGLEEEVRGGSKTYREAVDAMNAARDAAGSTIDGMLGEDQARAVKLRMGIRDAAPPPPPTGADAPEADWGGEAVPLDEAFKRGE